MIPPAATTLYNFNTLDCSDFNDRYFLWKVVICIHGVFYVLEDTVESGTLQAGAAITTRSYMLESEVHCCPSLAWARNNQKCILSLDEASRLACTLYPPPARNDIHRASSFRSPDGTDCSITSLGDLYMLRINSTVLYADMSQVRHIALALKTAGRSNIARV